MLNCKEATHLMSEMQDRPLGLAEKLQLEMHLALCQGCRNFRRQMDFLRAACRRLPFGKQTGDKDSSSG